jgi:hypothetical protein
MAADLFVVVEYNQASGRPHCALEDLCDDAVGAQDMATDLVKAARRRGRNEKYRVFRLEPVDTDDEFFEPTLAGRRITDGPAV